MATIKSLEEKAKRYDEAFERAKERYKNMPLYDLEYIFPELAESEDEKIRKSIIELVKQSSDLLYSPNQKSMLAWLEKQGEQKPEVRTTGYWNVQEVEQKPVDWSEEDENMLQSILDEYKSMAIEKRNWLKSLRPQKQQEWTQDDIDMIDWLIRCCEKEHEELCNDRYGHQEIVSDLKRDCRKKWDWLESLKGKVVPQKQWKPTE